MVNFLLDLLIVPFRGNLEIRFYFNIEDLGCDDFYFLFFYNKNLNCLGANFLLMASSKEGVEHPQ